MLDNLEDKNNLNFSPLGKKTKYVSTYAPDLLFPIPREIKRREIGIYNELPFFGFDTWNAYEVSWLSENGKPNVAIIQFDIAADSKNIIESKSFKLYLNSFNNTKLKSKEKLLEILEKDLKTAVQGDIKIKFYQLKDFKDVELKNFDGEYIDDFDGDFEINNTDSSYLMVNSTNIVSEKLCSDLLKSNCLVTGQPDWGSISIEYKGPQIDKLSLLKYIVSYRNHNEFHEQCVERIFKDLLEHCKPVELTVEARYTRRGGLDINPIRSTNKILTATNLRMPRQ